MRNPDFNRRVVSGSACFEENHFPSQERGAARRARDPSFLPRCAALPGFSARYERNPDKLSALRAVDANTRCATKRKGGESAREIGEDEGREEERQHEISDAPVTQAFPYFHFLSPSPSSLSPLSSLCFSASFSPSHLPARVVVSLFLYPVCLPRA